MSTQRKENSSWFTKSVVAPVIGTLALVVVGCSGNLDTTYEGTSDEELTNSENGITAVSISGGTIDADTQETTNNMNTAVFKVLTEKVEEELSAQLESGELDEEALEMGEVEGDLSGKDVRVGLSGRGITLFIENEVVEFAGGEMSLNGDVGLKLKLRGFGRVDVIASGELTAILQGLERSGFAGDIPYVLTLDGSNKMAVNGVLSTTIKSFKITSLSGSLTSSIVDSDVVATGTIGDKAVSGAVDMVDVAVKLENKDILKAPGNIAVSCTGTVETRINEGVVATCKISPTCNSCL